jgi:hypothetical protein
MARRSDRYCDGMICTGETYKNVGGNVRRAIDSHEGEKINESAFKALIRAAVKLNASKTKEAKPAPRSTSTR